MNLEAFIVEYSPKLQTLFLEYESWYDWLELEILHSNSKKRNFQMREHHYFPEIISVITLGQC